MALLLSARKFTAFVTFSDSSIAAPKSPNNEKFWLIYSDLFSLACICLRLWPKFTNDGTPVNFIASSSTESFRINLIFLHYRLGFREADSTSHTSLSYHSPYHCVNIDTFQMFEYMKHVWTQSYKLDVTSLLKPQTKILISKNSHVPTSFYSVLRSAHKILTFSRKVSLSKLIVEIYGTHLVKTSEIIT